MSKTYLVMRYEFWRHVRRRSFLFLVIGIPLLLMIIWGGVFIFFIGKAQEPIGVVDEANVLLTPAEYRASRLTTSITPFQMYPSQDQAHEALDEGDIQAFFVVPPDYLDTGSVTLYEKGEAFEGINQGIRRYLRASLLQAEAPELAPIFSRGLDVTFVSLSPEEEEDDNLFLALVLPYLFGIVFIVAVFSSSGWLIQAVVDEKENRTMEVLITSITPEQLMLGKTIGLIGVGLVQIGAWAGLPVIGILIAQASFDTLPPLIPPASTVFIAIAWFLPLYITIAALMGAIGVTVTAVAEGQQMVALISILTSFPLYFMFLVVDNPNSNLSVVLSYIPFSSPMTILARVSVTDVPWLQLLISWIILAATAVFSLFLVSRLLRVGLLRYDERLQWREIIAALRG